MNEKTLFTSFWTTESKTTRNVLAKIPEGSDYRPIPGRGPHARSRGRLSARSR